MAITKKTFTIPASFTVHDLPRQDHHRFVELNSPLINTFKVFAAQASDIPLLTKDDPTVIQNVPRKGFEIKAYSREWVLISHEEDAISFLHPITQLPWLIAKGPISDISFMFVKIGDRSTLTAVSVDDLHSHKHLCRTDNAFFFKDATLSSDVCVEKTVPCSELVPGHIFTMKKDPSPYYVVDRQDDAVILYHRGMFRTVSPTSTNYEQCDLTDATLHPATQAALVGLARSHTSIYNADAESNYAVLTPESTLLSSELETVLNALPNTRTGVDLEVRLEMRLTLAQITALLGENGPSTLLRVEGQWSQPHNRGPQSIMTMRCTLSFKVNKLRNGIQFKQIRTYCYMTRDQTSSGYIHSSKARNFTPQKLQDDLLSLSALPFAIEIQPRVRHVND